MTRSRPVLVYFLMVAVGAAAFLYPFWLPHGSLPTEAHGGDAPLVAALIGGLVVAAVLLEVRHGTMNGAAVALLGVLSASAGLLRLLDLPGGGNGIFFLVVLAGAAFGPRFGLLLGLCAMAVSAVLTGGLGPWLPFQMLALGWMGGGAGLVGRATSRLGAVSEIAVLAVYGWAWGFLYGAIMNLWSWPFVLDHGALSWDPSLGLTATLHRYWSFYVATSLGWDAAGALTNALLIALTGRALLRTLRRFATRLDPVVELELPGPTVDLERGGVLHSARLIDITASRGGSRSKSGADPQP
jgi:energy-coupling factor transport system substrate-specific component